MSDVWKRAVQSDIVADVDVEAVLFVYWVITLILCERVWFAMFPFTWNRSSQTSATILSTLRRLARSACVCTNSDTYHQRQKVLLCDVTVYIILYGWTAETAEPKNLSSTFPECCNSCRPLQISLHDIFLHSRWDKLAPAACLSQLMDSPPLIS